MLFGVEVPQAEVFAMQVSTGKDTSVRVKRNRGDLSMIPRSTQRVYCPLGVQIP